MTVTASDTAVPPQSKSRVYTLTINPPPTIATTACTARRNNRIRGFTLRVTGGPGRGRSPGPDPVSRRGSSSIPPGRSVPTGTLPLGGTYRFTLTVIDAAGAAATARFTITVSNRNGSC